MEKDEKCGCCDDSNEEGKEEQEFKEEYGALAVKYGLPGFDEMNDEFDIGKLDCNPDSLLRDVRKSIVNRFASMLNFVELLLNPTNGSMFHMYLVRGINGGDKEVLDKLFEELGELEIEAIALDINYDEKNEAEYIKKSFEAWKGMKDDFDKIVKKLKESWKKRDIKRERGYFG